MARVPYQPCAVCNTKFPVRPQAPHAKFCSTKCRVQSHRQDKQAVTQPATQSATPLQQTMKPEGSNAVNNKPQVTTEAPMSKTPQLFQPDPQHLKRLQDIEVDRYRDRVQCNIEGREQLGMFEEFDINGLQQALDKYAQLTVVEGYAATGEIRHVPKLIPAPTVDYVILCLRKPEAQVQKDIAKIMADVEFDYLARLEAEKSAAVAKEVESLMANERRKRQQAEQDAKVAVEKEEYDRVRAEVLQALGLGEKQ